MKKEILYKYLNNNCSDEEFEQFKDWIKKDSLSKEGKIMGIEDWTTFNSGKEIEESENYQTLLDKIHYEINLKEKTRSEWTIFPLYKMLNYFYRITAILFLPLLGIVLYMILNDSSHFYMTAGQSKDSIEIITPVGSRAVVQLSDGTEVNLNYESRIKYPVIFKGDTREIQLKGEAYFDVAHNPKKPFIVKTGNFNVKAFGTKFNVQSYPEDNIIETTLVEGKVVLGRVINNGKNIKTIGIMKPGQHIECDIKSCKVNLSEGRIEKYIAWKDGKLVFDNESISDIAKKLGRMFNVDIYIEEDARDYTYTATFKEEPLILILDLMTETTPIKYELFPRKKLPDGIYSKQKIRIEKLK